jgi:glycosyltransferase involved in cell wall biosynthesis
MEGSGGPVRLLHIAPVCYRYPGNGAELRNYHLGRRLAGQMMVTHVGFSRPGAEGFDMELGPAHRLISVPRGGRYRPLDLLRGIVGPVPFSVLNFARREMKRELDRCLHEQQFDIAVLESVHLGAYLPLLLGATRPPRVVVCDWHNIESEVLRRYAETSSNPLRRAYARRAASTLERFERRFVRFCDLHLTVSARDRETLIRYGVRAPVEIVENGVPLEEFPALHAHAGSRRFRILFVGAMDYHANEDAVLHFARTAWPEIHRCLPDCIFTVVGRAPGEDVRRLAGQPGVEVTGQVADVRPFYREARVAVAPLRVAGGTRIKILEAMAAGVPVVTSSRGAEGLDAEPGTHYVLADSAEEVSAAVTSLAGDGRRAEIMAAAGRELVRRRYDWAVLGDALAQRLLALAGAPGKASAAGAR